MMPDCDIFVIVPGDWRLARRTIDALLRRAPEESVRIHTVLTADDPFIEAELDRVVRIGGGQVQSHRLESGCSLIDGFNGCLRHASASLVGFVAPDTIIGSGCLQALRDAMEQHPDAGIAGPLMHGGNTHLFPMAPGSCVEYTAAWLREHGGDVFRATGIEPYCFLARRDRLDELGGLDPMFCAVGDAVTDFAMRASRVGAEPLIVPTAYAYRRGDTLLDQGLSASERARSAELLGGRWPELEASSENNRVALLYKAYCEDIRSELNIEPRRIPLTVDASMDILCILPTLNPYGGVISVVNLLNDLSLLGHRCTTVSLSDCSKHPHVIYSEPDWVAEWEEIPSLYAGRYDLVLATSWETVSYAKAIAEACPDAHAMYFIQDLEDQFYDFSDERRQRVSETYAQIPTRFAKTQYLCDEMTARGWPTHRIRPGMNLDLFYPRGHGDDDRLTVLGMVRYGHRHRGFDLVLETMRRVHEREPEVRMVLFGTPTLDDRNIPFPYENAGRVAPEELPKLYSRADVYLEMSRHHGFGRTGLEAMACGAACVLSDSGGLGEYARHGRNAMLVPVEDVDRAVESVCELLADGSMRERLVREGFRTAAQYAERLATDDFLNLVYRTHPRFQFWREVHGADDDAPGVAHAAPA